MALWANRDLFKSVKVFLSFLFQWVTKFWLFVPKLTYFSSTFLLNFKCQNNLGPLTCLVIGHDNAGITPRWLVESIIVRNEITDHIYKFPCGRWLGKGVDDDALERILIAQPLDQSDASREINSQNKIFSNGKEELLRADVIQEMLGNAINNLIKHFEKSDGQVRFNLAFTSNKN